MGPFTDDLSVSKIIRRRRGGRICPYVKKRPCDSVTFGFVPLSSSRQVLCVDLVLVLVI